MAEILAGIELPLRGRRRWRSLQAAEPSTEKRRESARIIASRRKLGRPISEPDAQIAAIARNYGAVLATRNTGDFDHCGVKLVNPWA